MFVFRGSLTMKIIFYKTKKKTSTNDKKLETTLVEDELPKWNIFM